MRLGLGPILRRWEGLPLAWQLAVWLLLFLLLSRLLYLPWSLEVAATDHNRIEAPRGTSLVLEGIGQEGESAVTLLFEGFEMVTVESDSARLTGESREFLASMGAELPAASAPTEVSWNVNLRPRPENPAGPGSLRIEALPAADADLAISARNGPLMLASSEAMLLRPVLDVSGRVGGWLMLGGADTGAEQDIAPQLELVPAGEAIARATVAYRNSEPRLILGPAFSLEESLPVRSVALLNESGDLVRRICGAESGQMMFWSALFQPRLEPQPPATACEPNHLIAGSAQLEDDKITVRLSGPAFVAGTADWLDRLKGNIVLWPVILALIAIPGQRLLKLAPALLGKKPA